MPSLPATSSEENKPALRRATYVHVSDLTSSYNIDHTQLEQEFFRVNTEKKVAEIPNTPGVLDAEVCTTSAEDFDTALVISAPQKRLQPPKGGYNLCVLVGNVTVVVDRRRVDKSRVRLAEVEVGDETGTVSLKARDAQIDVLQEVSRRSGAVVLRNCTLELFEGKHIRVAVTKWGKISVYPDNIASTPPPPSRMNLERHFSLIDLNVVASETVEQQTPSGFSNRAGKSFESQDTPAPAPKRPGQSSSRDQQQRPSIRRNTRDKRQPPRGKDTSSFMAASPHYPVNQAGATVAAMQHQQPGQMRYHGLPPYPSYDQSMNLSQPYPHAHSNRQQENVMVSASAQHLLLAQEQYNAMRQMQMYHHSQPSVHHQPAMGQGIQYAQVPEMTYQHLVPPGRFDNQVSTYGARLLPDQRQQRPSASPIAGPSPMSLDPVGGLGRGRGTLTEHPGSANVPMFSQHASHDKPGGMPSLNVTQESGVSHQQGNRAETQGRNVSRPSGLQFSSGKMNPEANAFAPSYATFSQHGGYPPPIPFPAFPPSSRTTTTTSPYAAVPTHHPHLLYAQQHQGGGGMVYMPAAAAEASTARSSRSATDSFGGGGGGDGSTSMKDSKTTPQKRKTMNSAEDRPTPR